MPEGYSLINLGEVSKPATVLIEKILNAIGVLYEPWHIKRIAKAEAEADIIKAQGQIELTELQRRAAIRFFSEEGRKQENIENIIVKSLPHLDENSNPKSVEDDWIVNFFDKCRIISDEEMQLLWAKVLAGEANTPGTYSKRTVNLLGSLDKDDTALFTSLCGFGWLIEKDIVPLIFDHEEEIYNNQDINFGDLAHLDDIGLIKHNYSILTNFKYKINSSQTTIFYHGIPLNVMFRKESNNELVTGRVSLTLTGLELAPICGSKPVDGFLDYVIEKWKKDGLNISSPYPKP